jgi:hypothetical protein
MNRRNKLIHERWHFAEVRRPVVRHKDWLVPEPATVLRNICHCHVVQIPEHVLIKYPTALAQANLYAVCQKIVLPEQVLLLYPIK